MTRKLVAICGLGAVLAFLVATWLAGSVLSAPVRQVLGDLPANLVGKKVEFPSASGATIRGWLIPGRAGSGTVVLMHGVRATRLSMLERARFLSAAGYGVLLFDFQAHGESPGAHITFGHLESRDAQAAVNFIQHALPGEQVGLIGVSLGGAAALLAEPKLEVEAMVLEMVYPTIEQAITNRLRMRLGPWAGALTPLLSWQLKPRLGCDPESLRPIDRVGGIPIPKLFIAGADDRHTPLDESRQLFQTARGPKELWVVAGAAHVDLHLIAKEEYEQRILDFFGRHLR
jgi:fermentation-respiration switch protein FrsA (DUF1100 family)